MICPHCGEEIVEDINYDKIMYNITKRFPENFKSSTGKWCVAFVVSKRNELEKRKTIEQVKMFIESTYGCVLNNDYSLSDEVKVERWGELGE